MDLKTSVKDKVIIVTGGLGDIGFEIVQRFLRQGAAHVSIMDIQTPNETVASARIQELAKEFGLKKFQSYICNVQDKESFKKCWELIKQKLEFVDILVNLAGIWNVKAADLTIDINFKATVNCTLVAINNMEVHKNGRGGVVVNVAAFKSFENCSNLPVYTPANRAIVAFVRSLEEHNKKLGVRIVCLCPLLVKTNISNIDLPDYSAKEDRQKPEAIALAVEEIIRRGQYGAVWGIGYDQSPFCISKDELERCGIP